MSAGVIKKVAGPLVVATGMRDANMFDVVRVGDERLIGDFGADAKNDGAWPGDELHSLRPLCQGLPDGAGAVNAFYFIGAAGFCGLP